MANKRLILHIGMPKTGTTSIQNFLTQFGERDPETGLWYPPEGRAGHAHYGLGMAMRDGEGPEGFERILGQIDGAPDGTTAVFSCETLSMQQPARVLECLPDRYVNSDEWDFHMVAYIRPHLDLLLSGYQQLVRTGQAPSRVEDFLRSPRAARAQIGYALREYHDALGDKLSVGALLKDRLPGGDVVADFLKRIESFGGKAPAYTPGEAPRANETLPPHGMALLMHARGLLPADTDEKTARQMLRRFYRQVMQRHDKESGELELSREDLEFVQGHLQEDAKIIDEIAFGGEPVFENDLMNRQPAAKTTSMDVMSYFSRNEVSKIDQAANRMLEKMG